MPGAVDPTTGMINTGGQPWMPGSTTTTGMFNASGQPFMSGSGGYARRSYGRRSYGWVLPPPPTSVPGRIIMSLVRNFASPQEVAWIPQLDGNLDFVLTGNETWLNVAVLESLLEELRQFGMQLGPNPLVKAAGNGMSAVGNGMVLMAVGMLAWFIMSAVLMHSSFDSFGENIGRNSFIIFAGFIVLVVCGFSRIISGTGNTYRELTTHLQATADACANFARTWSSKPENSMYDLTYRMGMTEPTYFELSPVASRTIAPPGVVADPTQAMYPSAPTQAMYPSAPPPPV